MLELLFEIIGEIILQVILEVLAEVGLRSLSEAFRRPPNPWLAAFGYVLFGAASGGLSLVVFPFHFVVHPSGRLANLFVTPLFVGFVMSVIGAWRLRRREELLRIDRFAYGSLFAFSLAYVRFIFAQ